MDIDLSKYEAAEYATMTVTDQFGDPLLYEGAEVSIEWAGPASEEYAKITSKIERENQAKIFAAMRNGGKATKESDSDARKSQVAKLVACAKKINNFPIGAEALFSNPKFGFIRDQGARFIEDWANFPSEYSKASAST